MATPDRQLRRFQRLRLQAGEQHEMIFTLTAEDLMLLDTSLKWVVEPGTFTVLVGASSDDIRLQAPFSVARMVTVE